MKKVVIIACSAMTLLGASVAAQAQGVYVGPGGIEFNRGGRDFDRRDERRWDRDRTGTIVERRTYDRDCRTVIVRDRTRSGEIVTRRIERC